MTKLEKDELESKITSEYGQPEWDMGCPANESAQRINDIREIYRKEKAKEGQEKKKEKDSLQNIAKNITKEKEQPLALPVFCTEQDLAPFTEDERKIALLKFENWNYTDTQISQRVHVARQTVTALWRTMAWKLLANRVYKELMEVEVLANLRQHARSDSKINMRLAEHYGIVKPEKTEIEINKPLDDPQAIKMLKELGDKLANE